MCPCESGHLLDDFGLGTLYEGTADSIGLCVIPDGLHDVVGARVHDGNTCF